MSTAPPTQPTNPGSGAPLAQDHLQQMEAERYRGFLQALEICHYVWGGLSFLGSCFASIYFFMGLAFMSGGMQNSGGQGPPPGVGIFFMIFGGILMAMLLTTGILNIISGYSLRKRKRMMLSMIVAGLNCISVPLGTALGVFTFILLSNDNVTRMYATAANGNVGASTGENPYGRY